MALMNDLDMKHHWDPEKTVDESVLEELKKQYNFDYNAM